MTTSADNFECHKFKGNEIPATEVMSMYAETLAEEALGKDSRIRYVRIERVH